MKDNNETGQRVHIVSNELYVPGGSCPDLPDSVYLNREDAVKRIKHLYDSLKESWASSGIELSDKHQDTYCEDDECMVTSVSKAYYFHAYIVGSVPLITDYQRDWDILNNLAGTTDNC